MSALFEFDASIPCEFCESGWVDGDPVQGLYGPHYPILRCSACDGTGYQTIHVRPIDMEDLDRD